MKAKYCTLLMVALTAAPSISNAVYCTTGRGVEGVIVGSTCLPFPEDYAPKGYCDAGGVVGMHVGTRCLPLPNSMPNEHYDEHEGYENEHYDEY